MLIYAYALVVAAFHVPLRSIWVMVSWATHELHACAVWHLLINLSVVFPDIW